MIELAFVSFLFAITFLAASAGIFCLAAVILEFITLGSP